MIRFGSETEHIEIEALEHLTDEEVGGPGSMRTRVSVRLQDFSGSNSEVWLSVDFVRDFVSQLRKLVDTRKDTARLEAEELQFELKPIDRVGHYEVGVRLSEHQFSGPTYWKTTVSGGFEVSPDQLPRILRSFEELLASHRANRVGPHRPEAG